MRAIGRMMGALALVVVGAWNVGAAAAAATNRSTPATATATAPAPAATILRTVKTDYSTPVATLKTLLTAAQQGDSATVRASMVIVPKLNDDVNVFLDAMAATARLQAEAEAKFGAMGAERFGKPSAAELTGQLKRVEAAALKINGDTATLDAPADPPSGQKGQNVRLMKVGNEWKVQGGEYFGLTQDAAEKTRERLVLTKRLTAIAEEVTKEIAAGKYYSSTMAYQEYWNRCMQATKTPAESAATPAAPTSMPKPPVPPATAPAPAAGGNAEKNGQ
jgi:hypothetical protein